MIGVPLATYGDAISFPHVKFGGNSRTTISIIDFEYARIAHRRADTLHVPKKRLIGYPTTALEL